MSAEYEAIFPVLLAIEELQAEIERRRENSDNAVADALELAAQRIRACTTGEAFQKGREQLAKMQASGRDEAEKPLGTTERNSLLTIINALCMHSGIRLAERGVAVQIAKITEEAGTPVSEDTVRRALEKIPAAVEGRTK